MHSIEWINGGQGLFWLSDAQQPGSRPDRRKLRGLWRADNHWIICCVIHMLQYGALTGGKATHFGIRALAGCIPLLPHHGAGRKYLYNAVPTAGTLWAANQETMSRWLPEPHTGLQAPEPWEQASQRLISGPKSAFLIPKQHQPEPAGTTIGNYVRGMAVR
jgi:hypothetical protein